MVSDGKEVDRREGFHSGKQLGEWYIEHSNCKYETVGKSPEMAYFTPRNYRRWTYSGRNLAGHCIDHGYSREDVRGKTYEQLVFLHSYAHNNPGRLYRGPMLASRKTQPPRRAVQGRRTMRASSSRAYCPTCPNG